MGGWKIFIIGLLLAPIGYFVEAPPTSLWHDSAPISTVAGSMIGAGLVIMIIDIRWWLQDRAEMKRFRRYDE